MTEESVTTARNLQDNCSKYQATDAVDLPKWKNNYLCGKKMDVNYDKVVTSQSGKCPNNYFACGTDGSGTLCFPS